MQRQPKPKKSIDSLIREIESGVSSLSLEMTKDLEIAERIQKALRPQKFPDVHGIKVMQKYLSGLKSGGDYFDFFEFEDKMNVGFLMSDSTGYGISAAFLSMILRLTVKFSKEQGRSPAETISSICEELKITMKPKESFSIFYGILNRKTYEMKYASFGSVRCYHHTSNGLQKLKSCADALVKDGQVEAKDEFMQIEPSDRLVLLSDGFSEIYRSEDKTTEVLKQFFGKDSLKLVNEFTYEIKKKFTDEDDMPEQDASALILDFNEKLIRLAK